jgi:hypothetical protein
MSCKFYTILIIIIFPKYTRVPVHATYKMLKLKSKLELFYMMLYLNLIYNETGANMD